MQEFYRACVAIGLTTLLLACGQQQPPSDGFDLQDTLGGDDLQGYARATAPRPFEFPDDHGSHPEFRSEWWYVTGNLRNTDGEAFGYQITFFRFAASPEAAPRRSNWGTNQTWMAHLALSDIGAKTHHKEERFARGAAGLAGVRLHPFRVWLEDWEMSGADDFPWHIRANAEDFALDLELKPQKPIVLQGDRGLSQKSREPGNASYYYSITRLQTRGSIRVGDRKHPVTGLSWLDREWSTSALGENQAGWDWFSLQLDDGRDLMFYQLRRKDGSRDSTSRGVLVAADGVYDRLNFDDVRLEPEDYWEGPSGTTYPIGWRMRVPNRGIDWRIRAAFPAQLMDLAVRYWEGSVQVNDTRSGQPIGRGYLEMTGY